MIPATLFRLALAALLVPALASAQQGHPSGVPDDGSQNVQMCIGFHCIPGGQHEAYIVKALQEYRSGSRTHPSMRAIAASLSDKDIADLAAYYASAAAKTASK